MVSFDTCLKNAEKIAKKYFGDEVNIVSYSDLGNRYIFFAQYDTEDPDKQLADNEIPISKETGKETELGYVRFIDDIFYTMKVIDL